MVPNDNGPPEEIESRNQPTMPEPYFPSKQADMMQTGVRTAEQKKAVLGTVPVESVVVTEFDARPINAYDWRSNGGVIANGDSETLIRGFYFNYTVPNGYRCIVRGYRYSLSSLLAIAERDCITGKFTVGGAAATINPDNVQINGIDVAGMTNLLHGQSMTDFLPCYILADMQQVVTFIGIFSDDFADELALVQDEQTVTINVELYGNLLLSTSRPLEYEPGLATPIPTYDKSGYGEKFEKGLIFDPKPIQNAPLPPPAPAFANAPTPPPIAAPRPGNNQPINRLALSAGQFTHGGMRAPEPRKPAPTRNWFTRK